jgi:hypothetical protein
LKAGRVNKTPEKGEEMDKTADEITYDKKG